MGRWRQLLCRVLPLLRKSSPYPPSPHLHSFSRDSPSFFPWIPSRLLVLALSFPDAGSFPTYLRPLSPLGVLRPRMSTGSGPYRPSRALARERPGRVLREGTLGIALCRGVKNGQVGLCRLLPRLGPRRPCSWAPPSTRLTRLRSLFRWTSSVSSRR